MVGREDEQPFSDDPISLTSYAAYPNEKPFVNSHFVNMKPPSKAFPHSNRDAIIDALKKMQNRLKKIETTENSLYKAYPVRNTHEDSSGMGDGLINSFTISPRSEEVFVERRERPSSCCISHHLKNIEQINEKTVSTENRVFELEKQLERMRRVLNNVNHENESQKLKPRKKNKKIQEQVFEDIPVEEVVRPRRRSKTKSVERSRSKSAQNQQHFKLNIGEIPFVVGKVLAIYFF